MAKRKTNKQLLQKYINDTDGVYLAFAVSELVSKAHNILKNEAEVREQMKNSMVHPDLWINYHKDILKYLDSGE